MTMTTSNDHIAKAIVHSVAVELIERQQKVVLDALRDLKALQVEELRLYEEAIEAAKERARECESDY
jgi:uncharacterized protein YbjQ (UPF0145 family)